MKLQTSLVVATASFFRYVHVDVIKEEFSSCESHLETTSAVDVLDSVNTFLTDNKFAGNQSFITKNGVFWDVTPCGSCKNRHFDEHIASIISVKRISHLE
jgi:hypothetical protein